MCMRTLICLKLLLSPLLVSFSTGEAFIDRLEQCEPIKIPQCRSMPYNMTRMPNLHRHSSQENARLAFERFELLLNQNCSETLLFFLCSIYVPICTISFQPDPIPPCKGVCEKARAGCEPVMNAYNVSWPEALDCSRLPRYERGVCVSPEAIVSPSRRKDCKCRKRLRPKWRNYRKHHYDYAIRARVVRKKLNSGGQMKVRVQVTNVIRCGKVGLTSEVDLWTNSSCLCPSVKRGREYLILGHEDKRLNRLLILPNTIAAKWKDKWVKKIQKWDRRLHRPPSSGRRRSNGVHKGRTSLKKTNKIGKRKKTAIKRKRKRMNRRKSRLSQ
ncbi:secreted frizzled-related protein 3-like [Haliotis rubra]|uniref:secreted frizzled-related protein 3-like n=1 Tax=Haliotis rubra TaxID=36100 RepID=UPI001EE51AB2|nr:secreted frizzled-related protein 3-like [Haliotis rubra]